MKRIVSILFLLTTFSVLSAATSKKEPDPLLVVVLMVKNEEQVMAPTLQPYVDAGITSYFIFDTGSTDRTIEVTHEFFKKNKITDYSIGEEPFIDFAASRNRALELTEERFPNACFMLMVDAEWFMHNVKDLVEYCKTQVHENPTCYFVRLITAELDYFLPRMMRVGHKVRYTGVVHETIDMPTEGKVPAAVWFEVRPTEYGAEKSRKRLIRDRDLLLKYLAAHPESARDTFYLAQTLACLKEWENSYNYYMKRAQMNGWVEENYMAWYRAAEIAEIRAMEEDYDLWWPRAFQHYLKAYELRPHRIEPLVRVAYHYYQKKQYSTAYIFLKIACETPYPLFDILFVEKDFYTFYRYDLLCQCALSVGAFEISLQAARTALSERPNTPHLINILSRTSELIQRKTELQAEEQKWKPYQNIPPIQNTISALSTNAR